MYCTGGEHSFMSFLNIRGVAMDMLKFLLMSCFYFEVMAILFLFLFVCW